MEHALTHLDDSGAAHMVDISGKPASQRRAVASSTLRMRPDTLEAIRTAALKKGDAISVARVAGILAAKRVDELIPLCHTVPLNCVEIDFCFEEEALVVTATAETIGQTGVEMEALVACSIAALTLYDMAKAMEKGMVITETRLLAKSGGRSGDFQRMERE